MFSCGTDLAILRLIFALTCTFVKPVFPYVLPHPTIEILNPKGLRVSIPDAPGLTHFGFYANVNKVFWGNNCGEIIGNIYSMTNGRWIMEYPNLIIKNTDELHYMIYVQVNGIYYTNGVNVWSYCKGWLLFMDNFNYLNMSIWKHEVKMPLTPDYEFCLYINNQPQLQINDGQLHIKPDLLENIINENVITCGGFTLKLNRCTSTIVEECSRRALSYSILPPVTSARLTTKESFFLQYGRIEIRAKFPQGDWLYPEMWLEPKFSTNVDANYISGRVLLGMTRGNENLVNATNVSKIYDSRRLDFGVRVGAFPNVREILVSKLNEFGPRWTQDFHVYTTIWTSDGFTFLVDDEEIGRVKSDEWLSDLNTNKKNAPFDQEFYITLGVGVGGVQVFPDNTISSGLPKPWKNLGAKALWNFWNARNKWLPSWRRDGGQKTSFVIDYIKVWSY